MSSDRVRRSLLIFVPLAFLMSWYPYLLGKLHLVKTSGGMNPLGVMVAAVITAAICYRSTGVKALFGRYLRWRIAPSNYAFAVLLPIGITALAAALNLLMGAIHPSNTQLSAWPDMLPRFVFILVFIGVGEETGWRGFALPELQKRFSPLIASLLLGVIWAAWHIPLIGIEFQGSIIPAFLLGVMSASLLSTWLFNRADGSLLPVVLFHATVNSVGVGYIFPMFRGRDLTRLWWIYIALWICASLLTLRSCHMTRRPPLNAFQNEGQKSMQRAAP